jgi:glutamate 5-kinase
MKLENEKRSKEELSSIEIQGYASMGQLKLMQIYQTIFNKKVAQLLVTEKELTQTDFMKKLIKENIKKNRITLINYNDCIDFEELNKDNDTLAAEIMLYCGGNRLIILGKDYEGFKDKDGQLIEKISSITEEHYSNCKGKSKTGNGGFKTKLDAAKKILENNKELIIANINSHLKDIISGKAKRTLFSAGG